MKDDSCLDPVVRRFIEEAGAMTQSCGLGRVLGQLYAYLYFSPAPRSLGDMQRVLAISKGSASTCVRQLEQWGAVRKIWVKGDRKDYYEANDWFGQILKNVIVDTMANRMSALTSLLGEAACMSVALDSGNGEHHFIRSRIRQLRAFHMKAQKLWNGSVARIFLR